ncbi:hypothetical protein MVEN_00888300 [Mycena venus]|uniref:Uncharacterized protein n=1 Tax=Mycena venus TaxID=2733690 RepID=A0A8H6YFU5_9AGAR|nr:hypothetical protein MVEN_00888300 [Mycena venus]
MPSSAPICIASVHRALPHVSKMELDASMSALFDALAFHPVAQQKLLKLDLILQTDTMIKHVENLGLPVAHPTAVIIVECETLEHYIEVLKHPDIAKLLSEAEARFGFKSGASLFSADLVLRVDHEAPEGGSPRWAAMSIMKVPEDIHPKGHNDNLLPLFDDFVKMPLNEQHLRKHAIWIPNDYMNAHLSELGFPTRESLLLALIEAEISKIINF